MQTGRSPLYTQVYWIHLSHPCATYTPPSARYASTNCTGQSRSTAPRSFATCARLGPHAAMVETSSVTAKTARHPMPIGRAVRLDSSLTAVRLCPACGDDYRAQERGHQRRGIARL